MSNRQSISLQQKMQQKLSPQQIILMKLMQVSAMSIEQRIKEEIEGNPALEMPEGNEDKERDENSYEFDDDENEDSGIEKDNEFSIEDYLDDDETPDYRYHTNNYSEENNKDEYPIMSDKSFHESLIEQLQMRNLNEEDYQIALHIIGNIDDAGYLVRTPKAISDDMSFVKNIHVKEKHIEEILSVVQDFEPVGVGSRTLQECLQLQLKHKPQSENIKNAEIVIAEYFIEFSKKHYDRILKKTGMSALQLKNAMAEILKLNPKPGDISSDIFSQSHSIIPDFLVTVIGNNIEVQLNNSNIPELKVSRDYQEMLEHYSKSDDKQNLQNKEAIQFVRNRIDAAKWFIDAIKQRQNTLLSVINTIVRLQKDYFITGDERKLRPMILKDIANILQMDVSTISRVVSSKYVQTQFGTFLLKSLFSESFQNDEGDEVSTKEIKQVLKSIVDNENKSVPYTDDKILSILKDKGYGVARRTVAKYRDQLNIPPARLRKEL